MNKILNLLFITVIALFSCNSWGYSYGGVAVNSSGRFVAVGANNMAISDDGKTWELQVNEEHPGLWAIAVNNRGRFVAVGYDSIVTSDDGKTWTKVNYVPSTPLFKITADTQGNFVAVGEEGSIIISRDNGNTWAKVDDSKTNQNLFGIAANSDGTLVAVGGEGTIVTSPDNGNTWVKVDDPKIKSWLMTVTATGPSKFVAFGAKGVAVASEDNGRTWVKIVPETAGFDYLSGSVNSSGKLIAAGYDGSIVTLTSTPNGKKLVKAIDSKTTSRLNGIASRYSTVVAVGDNGTIVTSEDNGKTWNKRLLTSPQCAAPTASEVNIAYSPPLNKGKNGSMNLVVTANDATVKGIEIWNWNTTRKLQYSETGKISLTDELQTRTNKYVYRVRNICEVNNPSTGGTFQVYSKFYEAEKYVQK